MKPLQISPNSFPSFLKKLPNKVIELLSLPLLYFPSCFKYPNRPLVRLCATLLPILRIWVKAIQLLVVRVDFADSRRWPYVINETSVLWRVFITASESPSSINSLMPSSCANVIALAAAMASTMTGENGNGACSDSEAMAFP